MKISIITLFPEVVTPYIKASILGRAEKKGLVGYEIVNLREFGEGRHQVVDGRPYGGGAGMVLKADALARAVQSSVASHQLSDKKQKAIKKHKVILTAANGKLFNQKMAERLSKEEHIIIICGHYEGVDARFIENYVDEEISIGDFVLTGGELPGLLIADSIVRLIKGVLEKEEATINESFSENLVEHPQYTRPDIFEGKRVPEVLISGNHKKIEEWKKEQSVIKTKKNRPEIL